MNEEIRVKVRSVAATFADLDNSIHNLIGYCSSNRDPEDFAAYLFLREISEAFAKNEVSTKLYAVKALAGAEGK